MQPHTQNQNQIEYIYLCIERHPDRGIGAAFTTEEGAQNFCKSNTYQGQELY